MGLPFSLILREERFRYKKYTLGHLAIERSAPDERHIHINHNSSNDNSFNFNKNGSFLL